MSIMLQAAQSGVSWSPERFKAFWKKPNNPSRVMGAVTEDIVG